MPEFSTLKDVLDQTLSQEFEKLNSSIG